MNFNRYFIHAEEAVNMLFQCILSLASHNAMGADSTTRKTIAWAQVTHQNVTIFLANIATILNRSSPLKDLLITQVNFVFYLLYNLFSPRSN